MIPNVQLLYEAGFFSELEYYFVMSLVRMAPEAGSEALLAAALVLQQTQAGHVCVDISAFGGKPVQTAEGERVADFRWPGPKKWLAKIRESRLVSSGEFAAPLVFDDAERLYLHRYWRYQEQLAGRLVDKGAQQVNELDASALAHGLDRVFGPISGLDSGTMQARKVAEQACLRRLAVVTGGPGTGKTTLVMQILALISEQWLTTTGQAPRIVALAPTGKASQRLGEVMGDRASAVSADPRVLESLPRKASTIHRFLGDLTDPDQEASPLTADIVVVDEVSMVDLALMHLLVSRLRPAAKLILLGDKDQLSSVESGAVLADICDAAASGKSVSIAAATSKLEISYRFDGKGGIGRLANAINSGDPAEAAAILKTDPSGQVRFVPAQSADSVRRALRSLVVRHFGEMVESGDPEEALERFARFRILTAHRRGAVGKEGIVRFVEGVLQQQGFLRLTGAWYRGRPVMVTRNDYQLGLFNGDIGVTLPAADVSSKLSVYFQESRELKPHLPARLPAVETAFAMTIHRSQGSEFDHVAVVLPEKPSPIVTRELLYTACTRARGRLTIIGPEALFRHAVITPTRRASGLKDRLIALSKTR